eukprot:Skav224830  [mRNA]  locus=scaffold3408:133009:136580:- [translate_table: standard]
MADITGVSEEWENKADLRAFVLEHRLLTVRPVGSKWCEPNRPNCTANSEALKPLLRRMRDDALKLPNLDDLKKEVADVFLRLSMKLPEKEVYTTAVELKKLCSFVKRRANRLEVTKDVKFHELILVLAPEAKDGPYQEAIDAYMNQCSVRSLGKQHSFEGTGDDGDHEDEETQQDFETFKTWLASVDKAAGETEKPKVDQQQPATNAKPTHGAGSGVPDRHPCVSKRVRKKSKPDPDQTANETTTASNAAQDQPASDATHEHEPPVEAKSRKAKAKAKAKAKQAEPGPKAKAKANTKARAKAKAKGQVTNEDKDIQTPKACPEKSDNEDEDEDDIPTPQIKRKLFDEDEAGEDEAQEKAPKLDPKAAHMERLQEELLPKPIRAARKAKATAKGQVDESGGSAVADKGKGRGRGRGRGNAKTPKKIVSPSIKKERARRQRTRAARNAQGGDEENLEDDLLRGIMVQRLKPVGVLTFDDLKSHLLTNDSDKHDCALLSIYWSRKACGVKWTGDASYPQVAYFSFKNPKIAYNELMTVAYVAGVLLVSYLLFM